MAEIALVAARRSRLQSLADEGDKAAAVAIRLGEEPTRFLSTVQIGITAIGILNGIVGDAAFSGPLASWLEQMGVPAGSSQLLATTLVVLLVTYLTIVIGELVPKRIGQSSAENIARLVARPVQVLALLSRPFVVLLSVSTAFVLRLLGREDNHQGDLTEDDIHALLREGSESGVIEPHEHEIVRKVFRLDDRSITSLMTPRSEIVWLDAEAPLTESLEKMAASNHSRLPVCWGSLDNVLGVISAKLLFRQQTTGLGMSLEKDLDPCIFVPDSLTGMQLLAQFRQSTVQLMFVVNEYGEVLGIVTLQDVLEALTGEFADSDPEEAWAVQRADGSWLLDGLIPLPELKDRLELKRLPGEERSRYNTLAGMMMQLLDQVPMVGAITQWEGWQLEVVDTDGNRLDRVLASRIDDVAVNTDAAPAAATEPAPDGAVKVDE